MQQFQEAWSVDTRQAVQVDGWLHRFMQVVRV